MTKIPESASATHEITQLYRYFFTADERDTRWPPEEDIWISLRRAKIKNLPTSLICNITNLSMNCRTTVFLVTDNE